MTNDAFETVPALSFHQGYARELTTSTTDGTGALTFIPRPQLFTKGYLCEEKRATNDCQYPQTVERSYKNDEAI